MSNQNYIYLGGKKMKISNNNEKIDIYSRRLLMISIIIFLCIVTILAIKNDYSKICISLFPVKIELWKKVQTYESENSIENLEAKTELKHNKDLKNITSY